MKHVNPKDLTVALPESDTVRVLREARALVKYKGWCQKVAKVTCFVSGQTSYCMTGALDEAAQSLGREYAPPAAFYALVEIIWGNIPDWNDAPERTLEEVLDAFDSAIAIVKRWESLG